MTALHLRCYPTNQCFREILANTRLRDIANCPAQATSPPSGAAFRATAARVPRSFLTLDLSSAEWSAKINVVEKGCAVDARTGAGRRASLNDPSLQPSINFANPFIAGTSCASQAEERRRLLRRFHLFCGQTRFLLDFPQRCTVACSTTFIEVPGRQCCHGHEATRGNRARGAAKDRESGCGQQHLPSRQRRHPRLRKAMP